MKDQRFGTIGNERYRGYTSDIHDNARHALALINRLLGGDAVEDAGDGLQTAELDLNALAESSVSAIRPLAEEAGLKLAHEFHGHLPRVTADGTTVKQILFNLLTNAIKFTPRGGDVRVVTGLGYDRSVFVAVQDTGVGMTAEVIAPRSNRRCRPTRSARRRAVTASDAAGAQSRASQWRAPRDRQHAERRHGRCAHLPARSRCGTHGAARPSPFQIRRFLIYWTRTRFCRLWQHAHVRDDQCGARHSRPIKIRRYRGLEPRLLE